MNHRSHIGRSFGDAHHLEDECPCPQEPCGLVALDRVVEDCPEHDLSKARTIRQSHDPENCPVKPRRALVEPEVEQMGYAAANKILRNRIERATAALSYFGPQGANIIAILEGTDAPTDL